MEHKLKNLKSSCYSWHGATKVKKIEQRNEEVHKKIVSLEDSRIEIGLNPVYGSWPIFASYIWWNVMKLKVICEW